MCVLYSVCGRLSVRMSECECVYIEVLVCMYVFMCVCMYV